MTYFILVMACAIAAGWVANRIQVPYPVVLVLAGIGFGFAFDWAELSLEPHLMLAIVCPPFSTRQRSTPRGEISA